MSPLKEPLEPVNENMGSGTGIGTLMPIYKKPSKQHINRCLRGQLRLPSWAVMFSASHISDTLTPWWQLRQQRTVRRKCILVCRRKLYAFLTSLDTMWERRFVNSIHYRFMLVSLLNVNVHISPYKCSSNLSSVNWRACPLHFTVNVAIKVSK